MSLSVALASPGALAAWPGLTLVPSHQVRAPAARIAPAVAARIDAATPAGAVDAAAITRAMLGVTGAQLYFGLDHRTALAFTAAAREGNCVEYAHLFAAGFNRMAARRGVTARAWVVRSQARLFGQRVPMRGWTDHDWVLVVGAAGARSYVDPTLDDTGMGYDLAPNVRGAVALPRR